MLICSPFYCMLDFCRCGHAIERKIVRDKYGIQADEFVCNCNNDFDFTWDDWCTHILLGPCASW